MKTPKLLMFATISFLLIVKSNAQTISSKEGFMLTASSTQLVASAKKSGETDITIVRSKKYKNAKIELSIPSLPKGVSAKIEADVNDSNLYHLTLSTDNTSKKGKHTLVLYGTNHTKRKGLMLTLNIDTLTGKENSFVSNSN